MKDYKNIKTFEELIELEHGKLGTETRNKYEENAQMFIESEMLIPSNQIVQKELSLEETSELKIK